MLARHPLTGKPIRIISLDTPIYRERKSLIWFGESTLPPNAGIWDRWEIGATSVSAAKKLLALGIRVDIVLCHNPVEETKAWCEAGEWAKARIVAVPKTFIKFMGMERLVKLRMGNLICLDEIHDLYPFIGDKWDGTSADAQTILAMILQEQSVFSTEKTETTRNLRNMVIQEQRKSPQALWLITQYYTPDKPNRRAEIQECLKKNLECQLIDKVILLNEKACAPRHEKLEEHVIGKRLTYADVIRWVYEKVPKDTMVAFANADIFIDDSWRNLWAIDLEAHPKFLALLRWEAKSSSKEDMDAAELFGPRPDSQDTWVVSSNAVKAATWNWAALDFPFGKGGCDNAITLEMYKNRFIVANPALTLKTYHLHSSGVRGYNPSDIVDKPVYLYIHPTGLHDKFALKDFNSLSSPSKLNFTSFDRPIKGPLSVSQARTFCTMVGRATQGEVMLTYNEPNTWSPSPVSLYRLGDVFQTKDGLVYTHVMMLVGEAKASMKAWSESQISYLSSAIQVDDAMIAPLPDEVATTPARFILEYMSKVFLLRKHFGSENGEFWCSKKPECVEAIKMFAWPNKEIPVLSREENQQSWCSNAAMWPYRDNAEFISREEVEALRGALGLGGWTETIEKRLLVVIDSKWVTSDVADAFEAQLNDKGFEVGIIWAGRTSLDSSLRAMRGAWGIIMFDQSMAPWTWVLPTGSFVWEIQCEMDPSASLLHLACASKLEHRLTIVPKGPNDVEKKNLVAKIVKGIGEELARSEELAVKEISPNAKPKILIPSGHTGFYSHSGDSFREIAAIWAERGYVDLVKSPCHQVWLNKVGDTLLYDRPTYQWLDQSPAKEQAWRVALFGNPKAKPNAKAWSFWPRRPALVESAVAQGIHKRTWESRNQTLVFYGRSENAVQKERRSKADWSSACSEFVHVDGLKPYPFTAEEYLDKLASSHYGLCLAGYGYKCHREIECMAMGCVPIVAPEVDMENYAEPPQEGLHYFRVKGPEEIAPLIKSITAERWMVMSAACHDWWLRNASVDGMWTLTKNLC